MSLDDPIHSCSNLDMSTMFSISEAAKRIGKSVKTLHRWDASGVLKAGRTPTGHRIYSESQIRECVEAMFKQGAE